MTINLLNELAARIAPSATAILQLHKVYPLVLHYSSLFTLIYLLIMQAKVLLKCKRRESGYEEFKGRIR
jgi:hypothetical protein